MSQPCWLSASVLPASFVTFPVVPTELLMLFLPLLALIPPLLIFPGAEFCQDWGYFFLLKPFLLSLLDL